MKILLVFIISILFLSCDKKQFDSKEELLEYLQNEKNGYLQKKYVNGFEFGLLYKPTDLIVNQSVNKTSTKEEVDSLREKYRNNIYFNLSLSKNNKELLSVAPKSTKEFGTLLNQLAFSIEDKMFLVTEKKDTIEMADYIYPRMYGVSGKTSLLCIYPRNNKILNNDFFYFTIQDIGFQTGEVKFKIMVRDINNEPKLSF